MATTKLTTKADRESTYIVNVAFLDDDSVAVTPNSATWSLYDITGKRVINSRLDVAITPATTADIVLSGNDLALPEEKDTWRLLVVEYVYDSDAGSGLPGRQSSTFEIDDTNSGADA